MRSPNTTAGRSPHRTRASSRTAVDESLAIPSCRALAEDIVNGYANELNCVFRLNDRINSLAAEMLTLGTSTRYTTGEDMARLRRLHDELSRSEPSEAPDGGADDDGGDST